MQRLTRKSKGQGLVQKMAQRNLTEVWPRNLCQFPLRLEERKDIFPSSEQYKSIFSFSCSMIIKDLLSRLLRLGIRNLCWIVQSLRHLMRGDFMKLKTKINNWKPSFWIQRRFLDIELDVSSDGGVRTAVFWEIHPWPSTCATLSVSAKCRQNCLCIYPYYQFICFTFEREEVERQRQR